MYTTIKAYSKESWSNFEKQVNTEGSVQGRTAIIHNIVNYKGLRITFYNNLTIMIEGFLNDSIDKELETLMDNVLYVGSDEVGVGENIGPIVVCVLSFENLDNKFKALKLSIKDSKKMSAKSVTATAKKIKEISNVQCRVFTPVEFNDMYKKMPNVKKINAMIQKQLHDKFGYSKESPHISDGFVSQKNFDNYLTSVGMVNEGIILEPGGEDKYIEVAAAAIVAKDLYNSWIIDYCSKNNMFLQIKEKLQLAKLWEDIKSGSVVVPDRNSFVKDWKK